MRELPYSVGQHGKVERGLVLWVVPEQQGGGGKFGLLGAGSARPFGSWPSRDRHRSGSGQGWGLLILVEFGEEGQLSIHEIGVPVLVPSPNEGVQEQRLRECCLLFLRAV